MEGPGVGCSLLGAGKRTEEAVSWYKSNPQALGEPYLQSLRGTEVTVSLQQHQEYPCFLGEGCTFTPSPPQWTRTEHWEHWKETPVWGQRLHRLLASQ